MPIFVGVRLIGIREHQIIKSVVFENKIAIFAYCSLYIFQNFIYMTKMSEYVVPKSLFIEIETDDLE